MPISPPTDPNALVTNPPPNTQTAPDTGQVMVSNSVPSSQTPDAQSATASSPAVPTAQTSTPASTQPTQAQPQAGQGAQQPAARPPRMGQPGQAQSGGTVSNQPPAQATESVRRAFGLRDVAQILAGGNRWTTTLDADGNRTVKPMPLSRGDIGMAIVAEVLSGAMSGLSAKPGPGVEGRAAATGFSNEMAQRQQAEQQAEDQRQTDYRNESAAYSRRASIAETNSRILLNTAEAEGRGVDTIQKIVETNKSLIDSYDDDGSLDGRNVTQQELIQGMQGPSPKYSSTDQLGPIDGYRLLGNGQVEATHALITDPSAKVPLSQEMWDGFAAAHVRGFPAGTKIGDGVLVPGIQIARANEQKTMIQLAQQRHDEVANALSQSDHPKVKALASQVPSIGALLNDPKTSPGLITALTKYQSYVSHADIAHNGRDLYESLQAMAQPSKPDPDNKGQFIPNKDAAFAPQIAQAYGGWDVLKAYHDEVVPEQIANEAQAADMLASSEPGSRAYKYAQRWVNANTQQKAAIAKASADAREAAKPAGPSSASLTQPDSLGFSPTVTNPKTANTRFGSFKKNLDSLSQTEQSYRQFQQGLASINRGDWNGAESVVSLFNAIGLSAAPLAGRGFRVNQNVIAEHQHARGWMGEIQAKLEGAEDGSIITPQQLTQYASIAQQARINQYVSTANAMHNAGISADAALPTGNGQKIDSDTVRVFLALTGGNKDKARQAAIAKGWSF
jgi:hypothetical protein